MKRTFQGLRTDIIKILTKKSMSIMELAKVTKSDYRTIQRQITWLIGEEKVRKSLKDNKYIYTKSHPQCYMLTRDEAKEILDTYGKAWETQDSNLILTIFDKNAKYHERFFDKPFSG